MSQNKSRPESESMPVRRTRFSSGIYFETKGVVTTEYLTAFSGRDPTKMRKLMVSFTKVSSKNQCYAPGVRTHASPSDR
jgi:hypothetical protein